MKIQVVLATDRAWLDKFQAIHAPFEVRLRRMTGRMRSRAFTILDRQWTIR